MKPIKEYVTEKFKSIKRYVSGVIQIQHRVITFLIVTILLFNIFYFCEFFPEKKDMATFLISILAAFLAYLAYINTLEQMRLSLLDERWEIYSEVLKFMSVVSKYGRIPSAADLKDEEKKKEISEALISAHNSFRGIGYHKVKSLFGKDVDEFFNKMNEAYASFVTDTDDDDKHLYFIVYSIAKLPDIFKPYVYFGDYNKNRFL